MDPIWTLLNSKKNTTEWNRKLRGGLKSVVVGKQYTQTRVMAAGWAKHNRCLACLQSIVEGEEASWQRAARIELLEADKEPGAVKVVASQEQINKAPVGNPFHRTWKCPQLEPSRLVHASLDDRNKTKNGWGSGSIAFERALVPRPPLAHKETGSGSDVPLEDSTNRRARKREDTHGRLSP